MSDWAVIPAVQKFDRRYNGMHMVNFIDCA